MADTSPTPPPPPPQPKPGSPIVDPAALLATFFSVIRGPGEFFKSAKEEKGLQRCVTFSVASWLVFGVLMLLERILYGHGFGAGVRELVQNVIFGFLGPFIDGLIIWIVCLILGSKAPYEPSVRIASYASAVMPIVGVFMLVKWIGWLGAVAACVYGLYIVVLGARTLNFEPPPPPSPPPTQAPPEA
ncbi:MAG TPA: YIP1 family protein [Anaeromyxobacter sp.]|nr:YIP1 family protein [Anaeromyxobacter sp.]